jgi:hypothetical protein
LVTTPEIKEGGEREREGREGSMSFGYNPGDKRGRLMSFGYNCCGCGCGCGACCACGCFGWRVAVVVLNLVVGVVVLVLVRGVAV